ncbi:MAG: M16 family metallopeptidase [Candidatus Eiseniibacteriota bacterium]
MDAVHSVAVGAWVRVGSRHEPPPDSGMTHFLEHMVFKGTHRRDALEIALAVESVGGHLDAFTGREATCYNARVLEEHFDVAVDVLADLALEPRLDPSDIEKEKGVIVEEIHNVDDTPDDRVHDLYAELVWQGHPLGNRILGSVDSVTAFTRQAIAAYHARHYTAPNILISVAGRFDWDRVVATVSEKFAAAPPGVPLRAASLQPDNRGVAHHVHDLTQLYLCVGSAGVPYEHPDRYALALVSTLLGGGMSSRLFQRVREQEGLAYSVFTYADSYRDTGIFCASMSVQPVHGRRALQLTLEEFERVAEQATPADELASCKAQLKGNLLLGLESTSNQMGRLARSEMYAGRDVPVEEMIAAVDRITVEDVRRVARDIVSRDRLCLVALGAGGERIFETSDLVPGAAA